MYRWTWRPRCSGFFLGFGKGKSWNPRKGFFHYTSGNKLIAGWKMDPKLRCNVFPIEDVDIPAIAMWSFTGPGTLQETNKPIAITPPKTNECPLKRIIYPPWGVLVFSGVPNILTPPPKRDYFNRNYIWTNHWFSGGSFVRFSSLIFFGSRNRIHRWATNKNPALLSIESWLFSRDPYNGLWNNPHITG